MCFLVFKHKAFFFSYLFKNDFYLNYIVVRRLTLYYFSPLKFVKSCFVASCMISFCEGSMYG